MNIDFTKSFDKQFQKLSPKQQKQVLAALAVFLDDVYTPQLRNHGLMGKWLGYRSITAGGDTRLHYQVITDTKVLFVAVGSHSQLYK